MLGRVVIALVVIAVSIGSTAAQQRLEPGQAFRDCAWCPEMVVIPAGGFTMGSPAGEKGHQDDEGPQHRVTFRRAFALGKHEVTRADFAAFARDAGHDAQGCIFWDGTEVRPEMSKSWRDPNFNQSERDPVVCVSWNDAKAYVRWLGRKTGQAYRLPSEAEWEYAARAGTTAARHWGEDADLACGYGNVHDRTSKAENGFTYKPHKCDDGYAKTAPAGSFRANGFGLHDVLGNVWEWVEDCWNDSYSGAPDSGRAWTTGECAQRVLRGGSWVSGRGFVRAANRIRFDTAIRYNVVGFRVAKTLP